MQMSCRPLIQPVHRRRFFQQAGGFFVAPLLGSQAMLATLVDPAPNQKLNIGVVGVGNHAGSNLAAMKGQNVAAICDVDSTYLDRARLHYGSAGVYRDWREMLQQPDLDAVVVSTPDHHHAGCSLQAMHKGLHVYCEKPLAHNIQETRLMKAVARHTGVVTQLGTQHHSSAGYQQAIRWLRDGILGPVSRVVAWTNRPTWPQGISRPRRGGRVPASLAWDLWLGPALERRYHQAYHPILWRGWWDFGSGALGDMGPHLLDPVVAGLELEGPERVESTSGPVNRWTYPEWSTVSWKFRQARGQDSPITLHWSDGSEKPAVEIESAGPRPSNGVLVIGTRGRMFIPDYGGLPRLLGNLNGEPKPKDLRPSSNHRQQWIEACQLGRRSSCDFDFAARLNEICLLGNISIRVGRSINWDNDGGRILNDPLANQLLGRDRRPGWEV